MEKSACHSDLGADIEGLVHIIFTPTIVLFALVLDGSLFPVEFRIQQGPNIVPEVPREL